MTRFRWALIFVSGKATIGSRVIVAEGVCLDGKSLEDTGTDDKLGFSNGFRFVQTVRLQN
jgi:hypothetical protein